MTLFKNTTFHSPCTSEKQNVCKFLTDKICLVGVLGHKVLIWIFLKENVLELKFPNCFSRKSSAKDELTEAVQNLGWKVKTIYQLNITQHQMENVLQIAHPSRLKPVYTP